MERCETASTAFVLRYVLLQLDVLDLTIDDGEFVVVYSGVEPGERVVTDGAYAVHLASLGAQEIGHGHAH